MINYILNKIFYGFLTLFGVVTVVFLMFSVLPGDPARMMLDQKEDPEQLAQIRKNLGLDQPLWKQYAFYLNDLSPISFHNIDENNTTYTSLSSDKYNYTKLMDFGTNEMVLKTPYLRESFQKQGKSVSTIIGETLPNTMVLAIAAINLFVFFTEFNFDILTTEIETCRNFLFSILNCMIYFKNLSF